MSFSNIDNDIADDDGFKRILCPVLSSNISPLRPSITSSLYCDTNQYESLFLESCAQIQEQIAYRRWPFSPVYLLHINTYCETEYRAIPAEIALVETTFWPQVYGSNLDIQSMNISDKINQHYERHSNSYKRFCSITDDFHDFVHPGDQLPTGYQADILEHSRRTHGLPCTPNDKIGTQDYDQLLDDLNEMLDSLYDFRGQTDRDSMPMFCTMDSFWSTKAALDWIYGQPSTKDRPDNYTLYPIEALIAVVYDSFYSRARFKCDLTVLMGKTPQQPVLHSRACEYHAILDNKYCAMAHVRDLAKYYVSLMAYLHYTYCDQNSATLLPYIKATYDGDLSLQQEAYWLGKKESYKKITRENGLVSNGSLNEKPLENSSNTMRRKPNGMNSISMLQNSKKTSLFLGENSNSDLNPLAIPFVIRTEPVLRTTDAEKTPAQLVLFEPRDSSSNERSCQIIYQRLHHPPREDWDRSEPCQHE